MEAVTYEQIENKIRRDKDLQDTDNFIGQDEMADYVNEGIDSAEALIMKIDEDYFLTKTVLSLVNGEEDISLPSDIYAQKIRGVVYKNGALIYPVKRLRNPWKFYKKAVIDYQVVNTEEYQYILRMDAGSSQAKIMLAPPAYESGAYLHFWYIRNAKRVPLQADGNSRATQTATVIDIPEFRSYIEQFAKVRCLEKMRDPQALMDAKENLKLLKEQMVDTLTQRTPDQDDEVPQDVSHYEEHN